MCLRHSKCLCERCNTVWPYRGWPSSDHSCGYCSYVNQPAIDLVSVTCLRQRYVNKFKIGPTLTLPYFQVKRTTTGRQHMMTQDKMRIAVRMTQFRDTTQGRSSSQDSQPSAHCRHSNIAESLYWLSISCRQ